MGVESTESAGRRGLGTIRSRLAVLATFVVAAVLVVSAVWVVLAQKHLLTAGIDESLVQRADNITADVAKSGYNSVLPTEGDPEDSFLQLLDERGQVVAASANADTLPAAARPLETGGREEFATVSELPLSTHEFRVLSRSISTASGPATLVVAKNLDDVSESVRILSTSLVLTIPVVVAALAALVWWLTGRVLRPVESIRAEVADIQGTELHRRVPVSRSHDEISRLAHTMNAMLDRVQRATDRQRQFVADASHELRTPLTRIRSEIEVGMAHPATADPASTYRSLLAETIQLQRLLDDLLFLARSESGAVDRPAEPVDLDDLVIEEARRLRERGRVNVDTRAVSAARVLGDPSQLVRVIRNLASNAERHAETEVTFSLKETNGHSELVVTDDGPGIATEHHGTVFKRFTRLDEARARDGGGSGLGLAIVHDIVTRHGGTIDITSPNGGGASFVLTLPRID